MRSAVSHLIAIISIGFFGFISALPSYSATPPELMLSDGSGNSVTIDSSGPVFGGACTPATCSTSLFSTSSGTVSWGGGRLGRLPCFPWLGLANHLSLPLKFF